MGFVANVLEDVDTWLSTKMSKDRNSALYKKETELLALKDSLNYRQTDLIYLVEKGFKYDKKRDEWNKIENIKDGKFPGRYHFFIKFPKNYPKTHPEIKAKPLHNGSVSSHILRGNYICVSKHEHGRPNTYWKQNMNIKGALLLARHLITDETHARKITKKKTNIEGTIFEDISKIKNQSKCKKDFIKYFKDNRIELNWSWEEIAYVYKKSDMNVKRELIKFYTKEKKNG